MTAYFQNVNEKFVASAIDTAIVGAKTGTSGSAHVAMWIAMQVIKGSNAYSLGTISDVIDKSGRYSPKSDKLTRLSVDAFKDIVIDEITDGNSPKWKALKKAILKMESEIKALKKDKKEEAQNDARKRDEVRKVLIKQRNAARALTMRGMQAAREIVWANGSEIWSKGDKIDVAGNIQITENGSIALALSDGGHMLMTMARLTMLGAKTFEERNTWVAAHDYETGEAEGSSDDGSTGTPVTPPAEQLKIDARAIDKAVLDEGIKIGLGSFGAHAEGFLRFLDRNIANGVKIKTVDKKDTTVNVIATMYAVVDRISEVLADCERTEYMSDKVTEKTGTEG